MAVLDGVNMQPEPDRYTAPGLASGEYLICARIIGAAADVCGSLVVG